MNSAMNCTRLLLRAVFMSGVYAVLGLPIVSYWLILFGAVVALMACWPNPEACWNDLCQQWVNDGAISIVYAAVAILACLPFCCGFVAVIVFLFRRLG